MKKAVLSLFVIIFTSSAFAGGFCVVAAEKSQANLVQDFLEALQPKLPKNMQALVPQLCFYVNPSEPYANELMSYSAEFDQAYKHPSRVFAQDPKNITTDFGIKINVTPKFVRLLEFAKSQRELTKEKAIQPEVLGYAGSFIVRSINIANKFKTNYFQDIRKNITETVHDMTTISNVSSAHEAMISCVREAIISQQEFVSEIPGAKQWAFDTSVSNPEFLDEKYLRFSDDGEFVTVDEKIIFKGQYRPAQIVYLIHQHGHSAERLRDFENELDKPPAEITQTEIDSVNAARIKRIGISDEKIAATKATIKELNDEFDLYINDSEASQILQKFIMIGKNPEEKDYYKLDRFIQIRDQLISNLPKLVKP
jgi:hypothetical protein